MEKRITNFFRFVSGKRLPVALMTMALVATDVAWAQISYVGEALPAEGGEFYLYNKGGNGFLVGDNSWGTQGSVNNPGIVCVLTPSNGRYKIVTNANSQAGLGRGVGGDGFVDNANPIEFDFIDPTPDDGVNEYVLSSSNGILYWAGEGTVLTLDKEGSDTDAQWLLVSKAQREQLLDDATRENGVDATFYIAGANFERLQYPADAWKETHSEGAVNICTPVAHSDVYYYVTEASNCDNFDIYQELTGLRNGRYRLSCNGFYKADGTARNALLYAGVNESPMLAGVDDGEGLPGNVTQAGEAFSNGRYGGNAVEAIVTDGTLRIGVKKNLHLDGDWTVFDNFRLTYLGEASQEEAFAVLLEALQSVQGEFQIAGAEAINKELQALYDQYVGGTGDEAAIQALNEAVSKANAVRSSTMSLSSSVTAAENYWKRIESGEVVLCDAVKSALQTQLAASKGVLTGSDMATMAAEADEGTVSMDEAVATAQNWVALSFSLVEAKNLADRMGGLESTEEYKKVQGDLQAADLTYDDMVLDVAALNALVREKLTPEFLSSVTAENELDMTSFITNPNIFNNTGVKGRVLPGGWLLGANDAADNGEWCTVASGDGALFAGNWSGNPGNAVTGVHYYQKIGFGEGAVTLPDGLYRMEAATMTSCDSAKMIMYASADSVNFSTTFLNREQAKWDEAITMGGTNTVVENVVVSGGLLYIGVRGADPANNHQGGNGKNWFADNFRLYYVGSDVLEAYRERLRGRLAQAQVWHDSLMVCGIDDADELGFALDPEDGYAYDVEDPDANEGLLLEAIDDIDRMMSEAQTILSNYSLLNPMLVNGRNFQQQLADGLLFAQPKVTNDFISALEEASVVGDDPSWKNWLSDDVTEQVGILSAITSDFMNSVALCYQMGTAKVLADQIGGLSEEQAYQNVVALLKSDEFDAIDADLAAMELQGKCIEALTPEVLERASVEEPFNMTTFIVNPNIYQDALDLENNPINTEINGWVCETNADGASRTEATSGDTWLYCYSWSGNASHNIASHTNYRQVVGTQPEVSADGKFQLPTGAYRLEAATCGHGLLRLYAQTNSVEVSTVTGSLGQDSIVYNYTEIESADSTFQNNQDVWNMAQASLGTTTVVPEIYVENGALTIGVRGDGENYVGGNGQSWKADNFRLYYVGTNRGDNINGTITDKTGKLSEVVDVYDLTGKLVRKQVKRADAVRGLKKGIYVVDGEKFVVSGN